MSNQEPRISVHVMLPDPIDRRFEKWAKRMPGASWPAWGGHITLVPSFVPSCPPPEVFDRVAMVVASCSPFRICLSEPMAVQDWTRPQYQAVLLTVADTKDHGEETLVQLQEKVAGALAPVRTEVRPELEDQEYVPHLTLALGLGETEATKLVIAIRNDPLEAEFTVESVWLVTMWKSDKPDPKVARVEVRFRNASTPLGLLSD